MPRDKFGNVADVIADPKSISSRMNIGRLYEQYFSGASRQTKRLITNYIQSLNKDLKAIDIIPNMSDAEAVNAFTIGLGLLEIIDTEQYTAYKDLVRNNDIVNIKAILTEIVEKEFFIYYKVTSRKKPYQIVLELKETIYGPPLDKCLIYKDGKYVESVNNLFIAPMYIMLLFKTGDEYLSVASAKTNHFNFPIGTSKTSKTRLPWRANPTKILSETETRVFNSYIGRLGVAELKDRANSIETHSHVYKNILNAPIPTNIDNLVDRSVQPYGTDTSLYLVNDIFNCAGIEIEYSKKKSS